MDTNTLPEQIAGGMDQRWFPGANAAQLVQNFRYEPSGGWRNDRGWEPLIPYDSPAPSYTPAALADIFQPCRFLSITIREERSTTSRSAMETCSMSSATGALSPQAR